MKSNKCESRQGVLRSHRALTPEATKFLMSVVATSSMWIVGCGANISDSVIVHRAPTSEKETGTIVTGLSENNMANILNSDSRLTVRIINREHKIFEVYGAKTEEIDQLVKTNLNFLSVDAKDVTVEHNAYVKLKDADVQAAPVDQDNRPPLVAAIEDNQGVKLEGDYLNFVSKCKLNRKIMPNIKVQDNQGRDKQNAGIYFDLGKSLKLDGSQSRANTTSGKVDLLWIVSPSDDSKLNPLFQVAPAVSFTPDSTGLHVYSVIAKDENDFCAVNMETFYVTANDHFNPTNSLDGSWSEKIDPATFWHVFHVGSRDSWSKAAGEGMMVAIIDTGVNYNHPALALNIYMNQNEIAENHVDDDKNGYVDDVTGYDFGNDDAYPFDDYGHGSHVAGIAASQVFGAARKAKILPVKFGAGVGFDIASVIGAIHYSVDQGAKVLNMSFGWKKDLASVRAALDYAEKKNVLVVVAAGNDSTPEKVADNDKTPSYPCNYTNANLIAVAATDENDVPTSYSNLGATTVHLAAPGGTPEKPIMSTYKKNPRDAQFVGLMGTSMATPLIVGVAAQVWSAKPDMSAPELKKLLLKTGKKSPALAGKISSGAVVDAQAALAALNGTGLQ